MQFERGVGLTDAVLGLAYYPLAQPYFLEWHAQLNIGLAFAWASAKAVGSLAQKVDGVPTLTPYVNTDGTSQKTSFTAGVSVCADAPLVWSIFLHGEAGYRFAQLGKLNTHLTSFGVQSDEATSVDFDYSGVLLSAGLRFEI